ncbi:MAG: TetR/AcrR family transcriptional regulator [Bacteroidota bacterium]
MIKRRATPEARRSQIIAAADLVLLEVGIDRFTVDQVIDKAKIAKGTIYNYYKDKDEMLAELGFKALSILYKSFKKAMQAHESSIDKVKAICKANYKYYKKYPQYFELISYMERPEFNINTNDYLKLSEDFTQMVICVVSEGEKKGEIRESLDPQTITYIIWACCIGVVQFVETKKKLLKKHHEINTEQMVDTFAEMITEGMRA